MPKTTKTPKVGRKADGSPSKAPGTHTNVLKTVAGFRGTAEYAAWVRKLRKHAGEPMADMIDSALVAYARSKGFPEMPPDRLGE